MGQLGKSLYETTAAFQLPVQPGPEEERGGEGEGTWGESQSTCREWGSSKSPDEGLVFSRWRSIL